MAAPWDGRFEELLPSVFAFLRSDKCHIVDDACLHKLKDILKAHVSSKEAVKACGLATFLQDVSQHLTKLDGAVLTLAVETVGWLGSTEDWFLSFQETIKSLLLAVNEAQSVEQDVSVMTVLFKSLTLIVQHRSGVQWVVESVADLIETAWELWKCGGVSLFLEKSILHFLSECWTSVDKWLKEDTQNKFSTEWFQRNTLSGLSAGLDEDRIRCKIKHNPALPTMKMLDFLLSSNHFSNITQSLLIDKQLALLICDLMMNAKGQLADLTHQVLTVIVKQGQSTISPDQVLRLIQKLFDTREEKMSQKLAAALLVGSNIPDELRNHLTAIVLYPISSLIESSTRDDDLSIATISWSKERLAEINKSRTLFVDLICHSLQCLIKSRTTSIDEVLAVLKFTTGDQLPSNHGDCQGLTSSHLIGHKRVQRLCLECFIQQQGTIDWETSQQFISLIISILKGTPEDSVIHSLCADCLLPWMEKICDKEKLQNSDKIPLDVELASVVQRHLCALQWEARDTTLEFLGKVLHKHSGSVTVVDWVKSHRLHVHACQCVRDAEAYVRASALACCGTFLHCDRLWDNLLEDQQLTEADFLTEILTILSSDTEAFARRAAVRFLHDFYEKSTNASLPRSPHSKRSNITEKTRKEMTKAIQDFDWEVKLAVLNFWEGLVTAGLDIARNKPNVRVADYALSLFNDSTAIRHSNDTEINLCLKSVFSLDKLGCWSVLFTAIKDFDLKVCERACNFIERGRVSLIDKLGTVEDEQLKKLCQDLTDSINGEVDEVCQPSLKKLKVENNTTSKENGQEENNRCQLYKIVSDLLSFDIDSYSCSFSSQSEYDTNPVSLLEDILSYGQKDVDDNMVDCY